MAFFESIVLPRVKLFESWRSYKWKPLKPLDLSEKISTLEETIGKTEVRFGRSGNKRKRLLGEQVEQKLLKKARTSGVGARIVRKLVNVTAFRDCVAADDENPRTLPRKETTRGYYCYKPHATNGMQLSYLQEFLVYLILIRTNLDKRISIQILWLYR